MITRKIIFILYFSLNSLHSFSTFKKNPVRLAQIHIFTHAEQRITKLTFHSGKYKNILITEVFENSEDNFTVQSLEPNTKQPDLTLDLKAELSRIKKLIANRMKEIGFDSSKERNIIGTIMNKDEVIISYPINGQE